MISSDKEENDEQFSGSELDESADKASETVQTEKDSKGVGRVYREKKTLSLCIVIGLCFFIGIGYLYLKVKKHNIPHQKEGTAQFDTLAIPKDQLLIFSSFVIPFEENRRFTYISLSIYFNLPNNELKGEMMEKKGELRGMIYQILKEEINKTEEVPSLEKLKAFVIEGVNAALSAGKVNEVYITRFLAV